MPVDGLASTLAPETLIGCPTCDAIYKVREPPVGGRAVCGRCGRVLITPRRNASITIVALTLTVSILVTAAVFFPFLEINAQGLGNRASLIDVVTSFRSGTLVFVSVATVATIVLVPLLRTLLILYALFPVVLGRHPVRGARGAYRLAQRLRPWAMTEVFAIGCAVSLVKVADLAQLDFGPAFWMFSLLVLVVLVNDVYMCNWSIWNELDQSAS